MKPPVLFIFSGQAGVGKTTASSFLSSSLSLPYFDYDTLVQPFLQGIERRYGIGDSRLSFYKEWRKESYLTLMSVVKENLKLGRSIVVSAPFTSELRERDFFSSMKKDGLEFVSVSFYLLPSFSLHKEMLSNRDSYRDEEVLADYEKYEREHKRTEPVWDADYSYVMEFSSFDGLFEKILSKAEVIIGLGEK